MLRIGYLVTRLSSAGLLPLVMGGGYFLAAVAVLHLTRGADGIATLWPSSGILFAALLIAPAQRVPAHVLAGTLASLGANLVSGINPLMSLGFTAANVLEALVGTWLLRRRGLGRVPFVDPKSLVAFCLASAGGAALSASIATFAVRLPSTAFWFSWFSTDLLGIWVVAPLILIAGKLLAIDRPHVRLQTGMETASVFILVAVVAALTFWQASYPLLFLPMLAILLAVFRLGPIGAAGGVLIVATVSSIALSFGYGPPALANVGALARNLFVQFYLVALFAAALPIATLLSARSRLIDELAEKMRLLQLAEGAAQVGHWRLDVSSGVVTWSNEVFRIHGLPNERAPDLIDAITRYHPDDRDTVTKAIERAVDEHSNFELTARIVRPDSEVRHVLVKGEIDSQDHRSRLGVFGIIQDVTDRIAYESNLQAARSRAESAAREAMLMAETDPLTGIANRRRTSALLDQAVLTSHASVEPLSVAVFDIDHFKQVNDTYGHQAGDEVLKRIVGDAAASIRSGDILGRFGGEEFVIVLPAAAVHVALQVANRVRAAVEDGNDNPHVTISVGVAELVAGETSEMLLRRADRALYAAKHAGRNTVRWAK